MIEFILFVIGIVILVKGADFLVDGASSLAFKWGIAPMVIGLTVVSFGTSAPELLVSMTSAFKGSTDIALGNVVGSNIFNIFLILGISAIIFPLKVQKNTVWKEIPFSFLAAIFVLILGFRTFIDERQFQSIVLAGSQVEGVITRSDGLTLLAFFIIFLYYTFGIAKVSGDSDIEIQKMSMVKIVLFIILGLVGLVIGSQVAIDNVIALARMLNISDTLIGFTLVSAGTSFPELFTNIAAARKKNADIAVGNIVGSNIFNIFLILGATSFVKDIPIRGIQIVDIMILWVATAVLFVSIFVWQRHTLGRKEGIIMVLGYIAYTAFLIYRG